MSAATPAPKFTNFRDAFCHVYKCPASHYESRLFFKSLFALRTLPALPIWWFNRALFAVDLDVINNLGRTGSSEEFANILRDLDSANHIERSIRRGLMKIRINPEKLRLIREDLDAWITPPVVVNVLEGAKVALDPMPGAPAVPVRAASASSRRLREAHREITSGRPLEEILGQFKMTEEELIAEAHEAADRAPEMRWLRDHLKHLQRLRGVEEEHEKLRRVLAAQAHELLELREKTGQKAG